VVDGGSGVQTTGKKGLKQGGWKGLLVNLFSVAFGRLWGVVSILRLYLGAHDIPAFNSMLQAWSGSYLTFVHPSARIAAFI
jgi:hypothetical protein